MILDTLNQLRIPYIVIKSKITSPFGEVGYYEYRIMTDADSRLSRLKFRRELEIKRYRDKYMHRIMTKREAEVFKSRRYAPTHSSDDGCIWEFNGDISRYERRYNTAE